MKCNLRRIIFEKTYIRWIAILISFLLQVALYIDSRDVATHELFEDRFQHLRYAALVREVPELIPCVRCDTPGRERINGIANWESGSRTSDKSDRRASWYTTFRSRSADNSIVAGHLGPVRRVSGFVFFEAFNDILHGPSELHEPYSSIYARRYNLLLKKWVHNKIYISN